MHKRKKSTLRSLLHAIVGFGLFAAVAWPFALQILPQSIINEADQGQPYGPVQFTILDDVAGTNVAGTFGLINGTLPPGITLSTSGVLSGTPTTPGYYFFGIRGTASVGGQTADGYYNIYVYSRPIITTSSMPQGRAGQPYSVQVQGAQGTPCGEGGPYYFSLDDDGYLPYGLTMDDDGLISGTPYYEGTYTFTVRIWDCSEASSSKTFNIVIKPEVMVTTSALPTAYLNAPYQAQLTSDPSTGITWYVYSGSLPMGLTLDTSTGMISGVPVAIGNYPFTVVASNGIEEAVFAGSPGRNASSPPVQLQISVDVPPLSFTPETLERGMVGAPYSQTFVPSGGTGSSSSAPSSPSGSTSDYSFRISSGQLPPGMTFNTATWTLSGTPTTAGTYTFTVLLTSGRVDFGRTLTLVIDPPVLSIQPPTLPEGYVGESYSAELSGVGGQAPYTFSVFSGQLPAGLTLASNGAITGTPTAAGTATVTFQVQDGAGKTATRQYTVVTRGTLTLGPSKLSDGVIGESYSSALTATGGRAPYEFTLVSGTLPQGLSLQSGGSVVGTPTAMGTSTFTARVTDANKKSVDAQVTLTVIGAVRITTQTLPNGTAGTAYSATVLAEGGRAPYTWSTNGPLPAGLSINSSSGVISGIPTESGSFSFTVQAMDQDGVPGSRGYGISIALPPPPTVTITELPPSSGPGQQPQFNVQTNTPYPLPITGVVNMSFAPDNGPDDPAVQFATGGRTANYTIPANGSTGQFTGTPAVQTGTVAGLITLVTRYNAGGTDVTPTPAPTQTLRVEGSAPTITSVTLTRTQGGFEVNIFGFSSTRQVTSAVFRLTAAPGGNVSTEPITVPVQSQFQAWYASDASAPFGSQFKLTIPFTVSAGDVAAIASVSAQLTSSAGAGNTVSASF